jgi:hypothetical protein
MNLRYSISSTHLYSFHDYQADLDQHPPKLQQHISVRGFGIFTHYFMVIRLLAAVDGLGKAEVSLKDLNHLNDPNILSVKHLK